MIVLRLFEGMLIVVHILWLFTFLFRFDVKIKLFTNISAFILLIIHLELEGYRWQMGLSYILFILLTVLTNEGTHSKEQKKCKVHGWEHEK